MAGERSRLWAIVPAAGVGTRMRGERPKQYLPLLGRPMLRHTIERLSRHPSVVGVVVALSDTDTCWDELAETLSDEPDGAPIAVAPGGAARSDSVINALDFLAGGLRRRTAHRAPPGDAPLPLPANPSDWVMVHDAARPCVRHDDVTALLETVQESGAVGGLLATPVRDTLKRADSDRLVETTVPRERLWHALTPQLFRLGALRDALRDATAAGIAITDEASAMERAGARPLLVAGHPDNIKVTHPHDLPLAEVFLKAQAQT